MENSKDLCIIRGCRGSGKSTLARQMLSDSQLIFDVDRYMLNEQGEYHYDSLQLMYAHKLCQWATISAMKEEHPLIIVSNTATSYSEMYPYVRAALDEGYQIYFLEPLTWWFQERNLDELAARTIHNVPRSVIKEMLQNYEPTLEDTERMIELILQTHDKN